MAQKPKAKPVAALRLVDLRPAWVIRDAARVGVAFDCPCGVALLACPRYAVLFANPPGGGPPAGQPAWRRAGETFETLSLSPSIKRFGGCGWHGHVADGAIVDAGDWTRS